MLEHHIQKSILRQLAFSEDGLRFSELQPEGVENKLFNYHLSIVVRDGLAEKSDVGTYRLTTDGRRLGLRAFAINDYTLAAHSVLFLVVRNGDQWLVYRRKAHPLIGKEGFMHAIPVAGKPVVEAASEELLAKTGLQATFQHRGSGFATVLSDGEPESFTHFDMLVADSTDGELQQLHENAEYFWVDDIDLTSEDLIPNMARLVELYQRDEPFFEEIIR